MVTSRKDWVLGKFLGLHQKLYEKTDGRVGASIGSRPMLLLRTTGRRSGETRTAALLYVPDGDDYVVIASKGGDDQHPGWYHNLVADPDVEVQIARERIPVRASVVDDDDDDRDRLWAAANEINKDQYDVYQSRTDRKIPVVVLSPR